eukprot:3070-Heterococcus_DN1.PRE.8
MVLPEPDGRLVFRLVQGKTTAAQTFSSYPLKFIAPTNLVAKPCSCYWLYVIGYGGGLLAQDNPVITCALEPGTTVALTTQASTKVYKRRSSIEKVSATVHSGCSQTLLCSVASGALLALLPDPVTCFRDASYRQTQVFNLEAGASLILCDWCTSGRMERGEI